MKNIVFTFLLPKRSLIYQKSARAERNINIFEFYLGAARFIVTRSTCSIILYGV